MDPDTHPVEDIELKEQEAALLKEIEVNLRNYGKEQENLITLSVLIFLQKQP